MFSRIQKMKAHNQTIFAIIIAFAVISFWRGIWGLMDLYIFPDNMQLSFIVSTIIGLIVLVITHYATKELM